jgi:PadR family transcriptional regulator, regulatory protein PadR
MAEFRMTTTVASVLREFLEDIDQRQYGFDLMRRCGLPSGSLYPVLARLERAGWIVGKVEEIDAAHEARPARKYYLLTGHGAVEASRELAVLSARLRPPTGLLRRPTEQGGFA